MTYKSQIPTGDKVGNDWTGPYWTPFAQGIADYYGTQIPWFFNTTVNFATTPARTTIVTRPQQHDVLIFGAHVQGSAGELPFVYLQVTHTESGVPWAVPNICPFVPLSAFAGINVNAMPNLKFPEVFFLPAKTSLKLDFSMLGQPSIANPAPFILTLIGIQLTYPRGGSAPKKVRMPGGESIRTDQRLPMFMTMGVGSRLAAGTFFLSNSQQRIQYLPPVGCDVEIHDLSTNMISTAFGIGTGATGVSNLAVKLTVQGIEKSWTPNYSPVTAVFGGPGGAVGGLTQVFPAMPYTKPYLLPKGERIKIAVVNRSITATFTQGLFTFRGVRLCEY